jgi:hypothetical protein
LRAGKALAIAEERLGVDDRAAGNYSDVTTSRERAPVWRVRRRWLLAVTLFGRVALGRPWRIEAIRDGERRAWDVAGWRESRLAMDDLRRSALGTGEPRTSRGRPVVGR